MKAKSRQERYKKGYILLEGKRLIADAIQAGADLLTIFVTDRKILDVISNDFFFILCEKKNNFLMFLVN